MNRRLQNLIDKGMIPNKGGVFIDSYNQSVNEEISGTITTRIDASNMSYVTEPNVLTPKRTDFGKQVRKQYENKEINMSRHDMTQLEPRQDGVSNTITSVQKDNLLAEPIILTVGYLNEGKHQQDYIQHEDGISRALCCGTHGSGPHLTKTMVSEKPIIIDDYNQRVPQDQDVIGTITTQFGNPAPRHGYKIAEPLRTHQTKYRIRKLTPREVFRLMGVTETDINKIQQSGVSQSQQYRMAGNSIVVDVLEHIFRKMFVDKGQESQQLSLF